MEISEYDVDIQSIGIVEIFHYSFNYIGILTGKKGGKIVDTVSIKLKLRQTDMHVRRQSWYIAWFGEYSMLFGASQKGDKPKKLLYLHW